uniref:Uncharacterized protein n=2 Tax=Aegilops tauschii subsp. strangulata TaxID=200361 RepID=A0A453A3W6_AEGTS
PRLLSSPRAGGGSRSRLEEALRDGDGAPHPFQKARRPRALRPSLAAAAATQHQPATARLLHSTTKMQKGLISSHAEPKRENPVWRFYRRAKWYHLLMMYGPAFVFGYASMWDRPDGKKEPAPDQYTFSCTKNL